MESAAAASQAARLQRVSQRQRIANRAIAPAIAAYHSGAVLRVTFPSVVVNSSKAELAGTSLTYAAAYWKVQNQKRPRTPVAARSATSRARDRTKPAATQPARRMLEPGARAS